MNVTETLAIGSALYPRTSTLHTSVPAGGHRQTRRPPDTAQPVPGLLDRSDGPGVFQDVVVVGELGITGQAAIFDGPGGARRLRRRLTAVAGATGLRRDEDRPVDTATILAALDRLTPHLSGDGESTAITLLRALTGGGLRVGALGTVSGPATPSNPDLGLRLLEKTGADTHLVTVTQQLGDFALLIPDAHGPSVLRHSPHAHPLVDFLQARWEQVVDYLAHARVVLLEVPVCEAVVDQYTALAAVLRRRNPHVRILVHSFGYPEAGDLLPLADHAQLVVVHDGDAHPLLADDPARADHNPVADIVTRGGGRAIVQIDSRTVQVIGPAPTTQPGSRPATNQPTQISDAFTWQETPDPVEDGPGRQRLAIVAALARHAATNPADVGRAARDAIASPRPPRRIPAPRMVEPTPAQLALVASTPIRRGKGDRDGLTDFVDTLTAAGHLPDPAWRTTFTRVPRHLFLPAFFVRHSGNRWRAIDRHHPDYWQLVYSDRGLATQLHGGLLPDPTRPPVARNHTSAGNRPGLIADLLHAITDTLHGPIQRVLHIGTGPGYTTALLAHRFGDTAVTTIEIDPTIADHTRQHLHQAGHHPHQVVGDGAGGYPDHAPYDVIIATYAVPTIPAAWITQVRDGGLIITGLCRGLPAGLLLRLHVRGGRASGRFLPTAAGLTPTRTIPPVPSPATTPDVSGGTSRKTLLPSHVLDHPDAQLWHALHVPRIARATTDSHTWLHADDGSWAAIDHTRHQVTQHGPRRIWDDIETAHHRWHNTGRPARDRIGVTATPTGTHRFWLDTPNTPLWTCDRTTAS